MEKTTAKTKTAAREWELIAEEYCRAAALRDAPLRDWTMTALYNDTATGRVPVTCPRCDAIIEIVTAHPSGIRGALVIVGKAATKPNPYKQAALDAAARESERAVFGTALDDNIYRASRVVELHRCIGARKPQLVRLDAYTRVSRVLRPGRNVSRPTRTPAPAPDMLDWIKAANRGAASAVAKKLAIVLSAIPVASKPRSYSASLKDLPALGAALKISRADLISAALDYYTAPSAYRDAYRAAAAALGLTAVIQAADTSADASAIDYSALDAAAHPALDKAIKLASYNNLEDK